MDRVRAVLKAKLCAGKTIQAINTWAVPVIRYSAGIVEWTKEEITKMDTKPVSCSRCTKRCIQYPASLGCISRERKEEEACSV